MDEMEQDLPTCDNFEDTPQVFATIVSIKDTKDRWKHLLDLINIAATNQNNDVLADKIIRLARAMIGDKL